VLRSDGTLWVNIGDSYATHNLGRKGYEHNFRKKDIGQSWKKPRQSLSEKSLVMIPFRFAIEMLNRGWICRNVLIWHKPNCMPASVKDRFTVDFEYIFFFVKNRKYFFEQQFEPYDGLINRWGGQIIKNNTDKQKSYFEMQKVSCTSGFREGGDCRPNSQGRNKRCVWQISTQPFPEAHFAVFPEALVEPMIKAGCPEFVCKKCGKAREKICQTESEIDHWNENYWYKFLLGSSHSNRHYKTALDVMKKWMVENNCYDYEQFYQWYSTQKKGNWSSGNLVYGQANKFDGMLPFPRPDKRLQTKVIGYSDCGCNASFEGGVVLDPFVGSGTTCLVAKKLNRRWIGIDVKPDYCRMAEKRIKEFERKDR